MQSTDLEEIKAALWEQASHPCTQVRWGVAQVMGVKKSKGHLLMLLKGWSRWYAVDAVSIVRPMLCPTGGVISWKRRAGQESGRTSLSSRLLNLQQSQLNRLRSSVWLAFRILRPLERKQPLRLVFAPQVQLRADKLGFQLTRFLDLADPLVISVKGDGIFGKRRGLVFDG